MIQEIFGVNGQIRRTADSGLAQQGYPLSRRRYSLTVSSRASEARLYETDFGKGRETRGKLSDDMIAADVQAAVNEALPVAKLALSACFGGYASFLAACKVDGVSGRHAVLRRRHRG